VKQARIANLSKDRDQSDATKGIIARLERQTGSCNDALVIHQHLCQEDRWQDAGQG